EHPVNRGVICAKGASGPMQHLSPARLQAPLKRVGPRGSGQFETISWEEALGTLSERLGRIRAEDPNRLAFFTGRDQSQALTGWWAQAFGTINYAAHGGFCSVNMAAAGLYTIGGSFWEFGEPDWEHTRTLWLWGVAEDHDSNPIKLGLSQLRKRGAKIVVINPVRTGYGALADEWIPIRPGSDGMLALALVHELLRTDRIDLSFLVRHANAHWLVIRAPGDPHDGLFARDREGRPLCAVRGDHVPRLVAADQPDLQPLLVGEVRLPDGREAVPVFQLIAERYLQPDYAPEAAERVTGIPAARIRRLAAELADTAFEQSFELAQPWTDAHGRQHATMTARPVAMHAMRGISAHANGFHTCRALHLLQMLLGAVDAPGSFRYQPPFPKPTPPANRPGKRRGEDGKLDAAPLGFPQSPEDLLVDENGQPQRIDHAYSWAHPLAVHGMLHTVIRNAWAGDPYPIDTLFLFMANMSWNSAMNTAQTQGWLTDTDPATGDYRIPFVVYSDAFASEMVAYADLVLPDTTYLERHDGISLLDRPISDADGASDAIRQPVFDPEREVRPFQSVLLDLGARLGLPGMVDSAGAPLYPDGYPEYLWKHERAPGVGLLAGWRGADGELQGKGSPNPEQLARYIEHGCHWHAPIPPAARYYKMSNRTYLDWAQGLGLLPGEVGTAAPIVLQLWSETLQRFRLAAQGHGRVQPPDALRARVERYFDPLPIWYPGSESAADAADDYPLAALTQRPMFMYHAWGSQNAWLRQIVARNRLYVHPQTLAAAGVEDGDWIWLVSQHSRLRCQVAASDTTEPGTVWTWNAIGKRRGAWALDPQAPEGTRGFLLNHLISDRTPDQQAANADPVTGQAAWFDLRVRIERCVEQAQGVEPAFEALPRPSGVPAPPTVLRHGAALRRHWQHEE
ncbi:MAG: molybdopterin oxidoreductase family protein, partial [Xanthomonadales bacterium]|nr:molybdopterin oxidoreductase family protein [Xanthomonadales bacterium]